MTFVLSLAASLVLLSASALALQPESGDGPWAMYLRRVGPVRIGMSLPQVRQALGDPAAAIAAGGPGASADGCSYLRSSRLPAGMRVMFESRRVVRVEVVAPGIRTASGIGVGSTEQDVQRVYPGKITVGPHKYTDGHYLTFVPADAADRGFGLVFETDGQRVTVFRTGTADAVALVEGCS